MAAVYYKMAVLLLVNVFRAVTAHASAQSFASDTSDDMERELIFRRSPSLKEWQYEGIPIEVPLRRSNPRENEVDAPLSPTTTATTAATTTPATTRAQPPPTRRSRRVFDPDEVAAIEEYPFMAAVLLNGALWCGGAVIHRDRVLTAAHCLQLQYNNRFFREYVKMLTVRVGSTNATAGGEVLRVTEIFFHPNYKPHTLQFNFAVLKLHKNMTFGKRNLNIDRIEYSRDTIIPVDKKIMFLGWGSVLGISGSGGQVLLQKVELPVYELADCRELYGRELVTRTNFCAGYITVAKNVCNHDAGGPAIMDGILVGILSFSAKRCDQVDRPAVFSTVGAIATWLEKLGEKKMQLRNTAIKLPESPIIQ